MPFLAPLITGIGTLVSGFVGFLGGLGFIGKLVFGLGLQLVSGYLQKKAADKARQAAQGVTLETRSGDTVSRCVGYGLLATGGHDIGYNNVFGPSNVYLQKVFTCFDCLCDGLSRVSVNGEWKSLGTYDADKGYELIPGILWAKPYNGAFPQTADAHLIATSNPPGRWTAAHRLDGIAYVIMTMKYSQESEMTSVPQLIFEWRGAKLYIPALDTTAGGAGSCRYDDPATWVYSENPIDALYHYQRGHKIDDELVCGLGLPASYLPLAPQFVARAICNEVVSYTAGAVSGTEARYRLSMEASAGEETSHGANIEAILQSCAGSLVERTDGFYPLAGANRPSVATLTDADFINGVPLYSSRRPRSELANTITPSCRDPESNWQVRSYESRVNSDLLAILGKRRNVAITWGMVRSPYQLQRLADIVLRGNAHQARGSGTLRPRWCVLEPGDRVTWQSDRYDFVLDFEIAATDEAPVTGETALQTEIALSQVSDGIYDPTVYQELPPITVSPAFPVYAQEAPAFLAQAVQIASTDIERVPGLRFSWSPIDDVTVDGVTVEYRRKGSTDSFYVTSAPGQASTGGVSDGVLALQTYEYRHRLVTDPPRAVAWTAWQEIDTLGMALPGLSVGLGQTQGDIIDVLARVNRLADDIAQRIEQVAHDAAAGTGQNIVDRKVLRKQLGNAVAQIITEAQLRADADGALASQITTLEASIEGTVATALTSLETRVDSVEGVNVAQASAITAVQAQGDQATAQGLLSFAVQSSPNAGSLVTINLMARAALSGTADQTAFKTSGLNIELYLDGGIVKSKVSILTDKFVVSDGTNTGTPLVFEGGVLKLQVAKIGTAIVDQLKSANDKLKITGTTGVASIELFS